MDRWTTDERRDAWRLFLQTQARLLLRLEQELEEERGLPLSWYEVLAHLDSTPCGRLRQQDLVRGLLLSKSGISRRIARMEEAGLVRREECEVDRRGSFAALTPKGKAALEAAKPVHVRGIKEHFLDHLTESEVATLRPALQKVLAGLEHPAEG